jgi:hypothetical protein
MRSRFRSFFLSKTEDGVRRVPCRYCRRNNSRFPKDSLWSLDLFRYESIMKQPGPACFAPPCRGLLSRVGFTGSAQNWTPSGLGVRLDRIAVVNNGGTGLSMRPKCRSMESWLSGINRLMRSPKHVTWAIPARIVRKVCPPRMIDMRCKH